MRGAINEPKGLQQPRIPIIVGGNGPKVTAGYAIKYADELNYVFLGPDETADRMRQAMRDTKGLGNFRNLFMYAPNGKPDGIKILPLSEVATKDDFFNIKKASRDDMLSAHRVPPQMMGIIPDNSGGFGDAVPDRAVRVEPPTTDVAVPAGLQLADQYHLLILHEDGDTQDRARDVAARLLRLLA